MMYQKENLEYGSSPYQINAIELQQEVQKGHLQAMQYFSADSVAKLDVAELLRQLVKSSPYNRAVLSGEEAWIYVGLGRTLFFAKQRKDSKRFDPSFPRGVAISQRRRVYPRSELDAWLASKSAMRASEVKS